LGHSSIMIHQSAFLPTPVRGSCAGKLKTNGKLVTNGRIVQVLAHKLVLTQYKNQLKKFLLI
jgi:hypothetical protein